jgi:hypothetical protein
MFCTFTLALTAVCVQCPIWLFDVFSQFRAFPVCCSGIVWVILKWFQSSLLHPVSLLLSHSTCPEFLSLYFKIFSGSFLITFQSPGIATSISVHVYFFIITDYDVQFIVGNSSVGSRLLVPWYGNFTCILLLLLNKIRCDGSWKHLDNNICARIAQLL